MDGQNSWIVVPCRIRLSSTSYDNCYEDGHVHWSLNPKYDGAVFFVFGDTRQDVVINEHGDGPAWRGSYETTVLLTNVDQLLTFFNQIGRSCVVDVENGVLCIEVYDDYRE